MNVLLLISALVALMLVGAWGVRADRVRRRRRALKPLMEQFERMQREIGDQLLPAFIAMVPVVRRAVAAFNDFGRAFVKEQREIGP